jgi:hypothetical protein
MLLGPLRNPGNLEKKDLKSNETELDEEDDHDDDDDDDEIKSVKIERPLKDKVKELLKEKRLSDINTGEYLTRTSSFQHQKILPPKKYLIICGWLFLYQ